MPKDYGKQSYYEKEETKKIIKTIKKNLSDLDREIKFTDKIKGKRVLIKPNLVAPYYKMGFKDDGIRKQQPQECLMQ